MSIGRVLRRVATALGVVVAILVGLVAWAFVFPPVYEAEHTIDFPNTRIKMQFAPSHPYLAEYARSVEVVWANGRESTAKLFPDTGGYSRSQLYQDSNGSLFIKGYFDVARINPAEGTIMVNSGPVPQAAKYLGAFAYVSDVGFRFRPPAASAEEPLIASGG